MPPNTWYSGTRSYKFLHILELGSQFNLILCQYENHILLKPVMEVFMGSNFCFSQFFFTWFIWEYSRICHTDVCLPVLDFKLGLSLVSSKSYCLNKSFDNFMHSEIMATCRTLSHVWILCRSDTEICSGTDEREGPHFSTCQESFTGKKLWSMETTLGSWTTANLKSSVSFLNIMKQDLEL